MHIVAIYNNKGGVGKSTLTVGLAEFLAANRKKRVLVIDLDIQTSSSRALLGPRLLAEAVKSRRTLAVLAGQVIETQSAVKSPDHYFTTRPASSVRGTALERIDVLVPDKAGILNLEAKLSPSRDTLILKNHLRPALRDLDFVLIDMPGNVKERDTLAVGGLVMSDFVLIPIEPNDIALNALPDTFDLIHHARNLGGNGHPAIIGMVLNKTDKRTQQFREKMPKILETANRGELPPIFDNFLPDTPQLATATDGTHDFESLKDRFGTYYDHVRKVARELEQRCEGREPRPESEPKRFGRRILDILSGVAQGKRGVRPRSKVLSVPLSAGPKG
jgi:chromosome partitioning protein